MISAEHIKRAEYLIAAVEANVTEPRGSFALAIAQSHLALAYVQQQELEQQQKLRDRVTGRPY